jgi:hypothetical protein
MTRFLKWSIWTQILKLIGFIVVMGSQWIEPLASSQYSTMLLIVGFLLTFIGASAGSGWFFFRKTYELLEAEELERIKRKRRG